MLLSKQLADYIGGLTIGQGRYAGQPFKLLGWQKRFLAGAFKKPGDAALSMGRGGGKSTFCAAIACATVDVDGPLVEPMAETLLVASSFDQGLICFRHMLHFLGPSMEAHPKRFRVQDSANRATITDRETGAMVRVLGSDPRRLHGVAPKILLLDEVAQWPPERVGPMLAALRTSRGKIADSRALFLGTRPATPDHPFQRALDGHGVGFSLCYAAPKDAPPFQRRTWLKANPGLDFLPDLEVVIRAESADAKRDESAMQSFRALRLNQGCADTVVSVLVDADTWRGAQALPEPVSRSTDYVLGIDAGQNAAMSAAAAYFRDGALEAVACFPELPSLAERGLADGVGDLYQRMASRGELFQAGRRVSDLPALLRECLDRWGRPVAIVCDRWRLAELKQHLESVQFPLTDLVERGQGFKDARPRCSRFSRGHARRSRPAVAVTAVDGGHERGPRDRRSERQLEAGQTRARRASREREGRCLRSRDCRSGGRISTLDRQAGPAALALSRRRVSRRHARLNTSRWAIVRRKILDSANWRCAVCGGYANEVDHIRPLHRGGDPWARTNLQAICRAHHIAKTRAEMRRSATPSELAWQRLVRELL